MLFLLKIKLSLLNYFHIMTAITPLKSHFVCVYKINYLF